MKQKIYRLIKANEDPTLENCFFPKEYEIPATDSVYIPSETKGEYGEVKYIKFARGEKDIYVENQAPKTQKGELTFKRGFMFVNVTDVARMKYLDKCNYNMSNPNRDETKQEIFFELKEGEEATNSLSSQYDFAEVIFTIRDMDIEDCRALSEVFNIPGYAEKDSQDLRYDLLNVAQNSLDGFNRVYNDDSTRDKMTISRAFREGILTLNGRNVKMQPSGRSIIVLQTSTDKLAELYDFFSTPNGKDLFILIKNKLNSPVSVTPEEIKESLMDAKNTSVTSKVENMTIPELLDAQMKLEDSILSYKAPFYYYGEERLFRSKNDVCAWLEERTHILKEIKNLLVINRDED